MNMDALAYLFAVDRNCAVQHELACLSYTGGEHGAEDGRV